MPKVKIDSKIIKKYVPDALSMDAFIYSHYKTIANSKKLIKENQKMLEVFDKYKQEAEAQQ